MFSFTEDHRFEQFFFNTGTTARLSRIARQFRRPLLLCMPSLAKDLEDRLHPYRLLDRDRRFTNLSGYEYFDLLNPHMIFEDFDAIFVDPPFANVTLPQLRETIDLLASCPPRRPALFICYIASREAQLMETFSPYQLRRENEPLGYRTVKAATQARIRLYASTATG
ncbi:MAG: hypothetical protein AAFV53_09985 [Myxococcota bacterium]